MQSNPLSEKIIVTGKIPFKLWLEFEISSPWEDIQNDFANIAVDTLDGRRYGLNVWTFKFLESAVKQDQQTDENLSGLYQIPPDLFVKELSRECIEKTIVDLLDKGNLEESLNSSIFNLEFLDPYRDAMEMEEKEVKSLLDELYLELPNKHPLSGVELELIARKTHNDDIVVELEDQRIAVVHLTWKSKKEMDEFPIVRMFKDNLEFWKLEMKSDVLAFKA